MKRTIYLLFVYLPGYVTDSDWLLTSHVHSSRRAAQKEAAKLWGDKKVRIRSAEVEEPTR